MVNPRNLDLLDHVRDVCLARGAYAWQIQVTSDYGRATEDGGLILDRGHYRRVGEKMVQYRRELEGTTCRVYSADCMGYMGSMERGLRSRPWHGCHAGIRCAGVMSNGNVKGCLSLPSAMHGEDRFVEGCVRQRPLQEIWRDTDAFGRNRAFDEQLLASFCRVCRYRDICRGGWNSFSLRICQQRASTQFCGLPGSPLGNSLSGDMNSRHVRMLFTHPRTSRSSSLMRPSSFYGA